MANETNRKSMELTKENSERKFRGRKLILDWGNLKIEISKLPYKGTIKDPSFELFGSGVLLANVYENEDGKLVDEILGSPAGFHGNGTDVVGYRIENYATEDMFWYTPGEVNERG